jgi:response regulator RpfG family c-di-GMP phosphodiesterase
MIRVVFLSRDKDQFAELELMLSRYDAQIELCGTGNDLFPLLSNTPKGEWIDLVVMEESLTDIDAVSLVKELIPKSPMTNCVVAGTMDKKQFHDTYEGYGVLMQISPEPSASDARDLEAGLKKIGVLK